jgi:streptogramin lyase
MERIGSLRGAWAATAAVLLIIVCGGLALASGETGTLTSWIVPTASSTPSGIVAADGIVYFGESHTDRLGRLDPATDAVTEWSVGQGPQELAMGPAGGVYFTERGADRIGRILPSGGFYTSETAGASGSEPMGVACDLTGVGTLWYTQRGAGKLTRLTLGGLLFDVLMVQVPSTRSASSSTTALEPTTITVTPRVTPGNPLLPPGIALAPGTTSGPYIDYEIGGTSTQLRDLAIAPDGTIFVSTEARSLRQFNPSSATVLYHDLPSDSASYGVDVDDAGWVWFTESAYERIGRLEPSSGDVVEWTIPDAQTVGVFAAPDGTVWFADRAGDRIGHLDPAMNTITLYPLATGSRPTDITLDAAGDVWFVTEANWVGRLAIGPVLGTPPLPDGIWAVSVAKVSDTQALVTVEYTYSGSQGLPVFLGGLPTVGGGQSPAFGFGPTRIETVGSGTISFSVFAADAACRTTDGITVYLYSSTRAQFVTQDQAIPLQWGACAPVSLGLPTILLSVDRGCGGAYAIGDSVSIAITPSETMTASLIDFQTDGTQKLIGVGTIPGGMTRVVHGTITGPAGTEAVLVRAETPSSLWISAGCTLVVGGAAMGAVSVSLDRGCGATYHYGESATAILRSSVAGVARLYQVTRTGTVALAAALPILPGVTERVSAPLGATTGTSTFLLQVTAASGQVHAATCSYNVIP